MGKLADQQIKAAEGKGLTRKEREFINRLKNDENFRNNWEYRAERRNQRRTERNMKNPDNDNNQRTTNFSKEKLRNEMIKKNPDLAPKKGRKLSKFEERVLSRQGEDKGKNRKKAAELNAKLKKKLQGLKDRKKLNEMMNELRKKRKPQDPTYRHYK